MPVDESRSDRFRLTAAGQVLHPDDGRRRDLPIWILRGDRPLHLQQRPFSGDGSHKVPSDSFRPRRPALRAALQSPAMTTQGDLQLYMRGWTSGIFGLW